MATIRMVFLSGVRQKVLYTQRMNSIWQVESNLVKRLDEEDLQDLNAVPLRKFWIDDEGDQVEIINDDDYDICLNNAGDHKTPEIFFMVLTEKPQPIFARNNLKAIENEKARTNLKSTDNKESSSLFSKAKSMVKRFWNGEENEHEQVMK